jgi:hypothetical protein
VEVIAHQTVGVHLKSRLLTGLRQRFDEILAVRIGLKDVPLPLALLITW